MKNKQTLTLLVVLALLLWACGPTYPGDTPPTLYPNPQLDDRVLTYNELRDEMHCEVLVNYDSSFTELLAIVDVLGFDEDTITLVLNDAGLLGDVIAADGLYSRNAVLSRIDSIEGKLDVTYELYNASTLLKSERDSLILIANLPPEITEITMSDTIVRPATGTEDLLISLAVDDPNGIYDVVSASFQVKSNTTGLWGSDIAMNDEGQTGDQVAGDGVFSTGLQISSANTAATNYFRFRVKDTAANFSDWSLDSVVVR